MQRTKPSQNDQMLAFVYAKMMLIPGTSTSISRILRIDSNMVYNHWNIKNIDRILLLADACAAFSYGSFFFAILPTTSQLEASLRCLPLSALWSSQRSSWSRTRARHVRFAMSWIYFVLNRFCRLWDNCTSFISLLFILVSWSLLKSCLSAQIDRLGKSWDLW